MHHSFLLLDFGEPKDSVTLQPEIGLNGQMFFVHIAHIIGNVHIFQTIFELLVGNGCYFFVQGIPPMMATEDVGPLSICIRTRIVHSNMITFRTENLDNTTHTDCKFNTRTHRIRINS